MVTKVATETAAPRRVPMRYEDYLALTDQTQIVEWVDGEGIFYMPPKYDHQNIVSFLDSILRFFVQQFDLGVMIPSPFEVKLWPDGPSREPDLLFVSRQNINRLEVDKVIGAPDLVIEVISPSSASEDRVHKFKEYELAGVQEYWIIDPRPRQQQGDFYRLNEAGRYESVSLGETGRFHSTVIPGFWLDVDWLWEEPLPNPQLIVAEIMLLLKTLPPELRSAYQALYAALKGTSPADEG